VLAAAAVGSDAPRTFNIDPWAPLLSTAATAYCLQTCLQTQDDTAILADISSNPPKLGYMDAFASDSLFNATPLTINFTSTSGGPSGTGVSTGIGTGLVIKRGVANFFSFNAGFGPASITVTVSDSDTA
jgi:hypothetical protein